MIENEIERIAHAINALRPDWPVSSLYTMLHRVEICHRPRRDVAVALTWVACESETKTPARVLEAGPWWAATNATSSGNGRYPPRAEQACPKHPGEWPENCRGCAGDRLGADTSDASNRGRAEGDVGRLRHLVAVATSGFCSHGVLPERCLDHRAKPDETTETEEQG